MKINEIIMEAPGQSGQNPALQSEAQRAQVEYRTLKKFSPQFANEFMQSFRLLGSNSVDAAYQAAAEKAGMDPRKAKEISNADAGSQEHQKAMQAFSSAMPNEYKKPELTYQDGVKDAASGYFGNQNARKTLGSRVADVWNQAKDVSIGNALGKGVDLGKAIGKNISQPLVRKT